MGSSKTLIWTGMFIGSTVGAYVPALWGTSVFSASSILFSTIGACVGIYLGFILGRMF